MPQKSGRGELTHGHNSLLASQVLSLRFQYLQEGRLNYLLSQQRGPRILSHSWAKTVSFGRFCGKWRYSPAIKTPFRDSTWELSKSRLVPSGRFLVRDRMSHITIPLSPCIIYWHYYKESHSLGVLLHQASCLWLTCLFSSSQLW